MSLVTSCTGENMQPRVYLLFHLRDSGSLMPLILCKIRYWCNFLSQTSLAFQEAVKMKSAQPYLVHICLLILPIYPSILECWSCLFVLATAAMYSYFLMFPVIVAVFPSLLPRFNPQNIQIAFTQGWKIRGLPSVTHMFSTFSQWLEINCTFPDIKLDI